MQIPFRAIIVFHAVARAGSISRAADELRVTPSAVSQQIQALELHLGTALTSRVGRNIALTEAGERYFEMISREIEHVTDVTQHVRGIRSATTLTVRAAPSVSSKWLLPRLAGFVEANPDIELRLDGTNEPTDFRKENVDLEIRHGEGGWAGLFVESLGKERFLPLCAPSAFAAGSLAAARPAQAPADPFGEIADAMAALVHRGRRRTWRNAGGACCSTAAIWRSTPPSTASASGWRASCWPGANCATAAGLPGEGSAGGRADHAVDRLSAWPSAPPQDPHLPRLVARGARCLERTAGCVDCLARLHRRRR